MKKKESKETKPGLKNTSAKNVTTDIAPKKHKELKVAKGSGGARKNSGRNSLEYETHRVEVKMPLSLYNDMLALSIPNITAYIISLVDKDVKRRKK